MWFSAHLLKQVADGGMVGVDDDFIANNICAELVTRKDNGKHLLLDGGVIQLGVI